MQAKTLFTAGILAIAAAGTSYGGTAYTCQTSGDWHTSTNWSPNGIPGSADSVTIPSGKTISVGTSNESIGKLLSVAGTLNVGAFKLTVDGTGASAPSNTHLIDGSIVLQSSSSVLEFNGLAADQTLDGSGFIRGEDNGAQLRIENAFVLINKIRIEGALIVQPVSGTATLKNVQDASMTPRVALRANIANSKLTLHANLILDETPYVSGLSSYYTRFEAVDAEGAEMEFNRATTNLHFSLKVDGGENCCGMIFNVNVTTAGLFTFTQGYVVVPNASTAFTAGNYGPLSGPDSDSAGDCDAP